MARNQNYFRPHNIAEYVDTNLKKEEEEEIYLYQLIFVPSGDYLYLEKYFYGV